MNYTLATVRVAMNGEFEYLGNIPESRIGKNRRVVKAARNFKVPAGKPSFEQPEDLGEI